MPAVRALTSFAAPGRRHVREGEVIDSSDPIVKGRESLFEPVEDHISRQVEQATAAPGEKRTVRKAAPKSGK